MAASSVPSSSSPYVFYEKVVYKLHNLKPGEVMVYYDGFLDAERINSPFGPASMAANVAMDLSQRGRVTLTQKRKSPPTIRGGIIDWRYGSGEGFLYIAIGLEPKDKKWSKQ